MTDTQTVDLAAWLTQIWDEEERLAKAAPQQPWFSTLETGDDAENFGSVWVGTDGTWKNAQTVADWYKPGAGDHIAYHDPASVLARIAADRKILALHTPTQAQLGPKTIRACSVCGYPEMGVIAPWPCLTLRLLASPYADRPGYRDEWLIDAT